MSERPHARGRDVLAAARALVEEDGAQALTMRRLADRLGIRAPSLYKHVPDKAAIEAALAAEFLGEFGAEFGAAADLAGITAAYRRLALANPGLYRLATDRPLRRDRLPEGLEDEVAGVLRAAVGGDADLARAAWAWAHGMVTLELAGRFPAGADLDAAWAAGVRAFGGS